MQELRLLHQMNTNQQVGIGTRTDALSCDVILSIHPIAEQEIQALGE